MSITRSGSTNVASPPKRDKTAYLINTDSRARETLAILLKQYGVKSWGFESPREFSTYREKGDLVRPSCVVSEIDFPSGSGLQLLRTPFWEHPCPAVVFASPRVSVSTAVAAIKAGAFNVFEKTWNDPDLKRQVDSAIQADAQRRQEFEMLRSLAASLESLTEREALVLELILKGNVNKAIARKINVSVRTIENDRASLLTKFNVDNAIELAARVTELEVRSWALRSIRGAATAEAPPHRNWAYGFNGSKAVSI